MVPKTSTPEKPSLLSSLPRKVSSNTPTWETSAVSLMKLTAKATAGGRITGQDWGMMTALHGNEIELVALAEAVAEVRSVPVQEYERHGAAASVSRAGREPTFAWHGFALGSGSGSSSASSFEICLMRTCALEPSADVCCWNEKNGFATPSPRLNPSQLTVGPCSVDSTRASGVDQPAPGTRSSERALHRARDALDNWSERPSPRWRLTSNPAVEFRCPSRTTFF